MAAQAALIIKVSQSPATVRSNSPQSNTALHMATLDDAELRRQQAPFQFTEVIKRSNKHRESRVPLQNIPSTQAGWMIFGTEREWQARPDTSARTATEYTGGRHAPLITARLRDGIQRRDRAREPAMRSDSTRAHAGIRSPTPNQGKARRQSNNISRIDKSRQRESDSAESWCS